jgi:hypothetical protein
VRDRGDVMGMPKRRLIGKENNLGLAKQHTSRNPRFHSRLVRGARSSGFWQQEQPMESFSRRDVLAVTATGGLMRAAASVSAQTFGNPDLPPQGAINAKKP